MQFFEHQDQARGRTSLLVALFSIAVIGLGVVSGAATHFALSFDLPPSEPLPENHWATVATAAIVTWGIILLGSGYRLAELRKGGVKIAETLGGTLLTSTTEDPLERRAFNIVEEMAIAAGLPVPPVYIMRQEKGINAFAAGWSPNDAVIGLTTGALEGLNRDQLQGVIAHEFSHILNRDCALNMRLIGVLHGIVIISILGRVVMQLGMGSRHRSTRSEGGGVQFLVAGAAIWIFGSLGVLLARVIQSAVSQQREYLADASAVQFTRNPEGIAGALATIGSQTSALSTPRAGETSHMLISEPGESSFLGSLASHPPLFTRIQRVLPRWDGDFEALATPPGTVRQMFESREKKIGLDGKEIVEEMMTGGVIPGFPVLPDGYGVPQTAQVGGSVAETALILESVETRPGPQKAKASTPSAPQPLLSQAALLLASIPPTLRVAAEDPFSSRALIFSWVLDQEIEAREAQMALLRNDPALALETNKLRNLIPSLEPPAKLPLFDIALGTLAALSDRQKAEFLEQLEALQARLASGSYRNFCLAALAIRHLDPGGRSHKVKPVLIKEAIETILGVLAIQGHDTLGEAAAAFANGRAQLGKRGKNLKLPSADALSVHRLDASFSTLNRLPHGTRAGILDAAEFIASHDGEVRPSEAELLRAIAACFNIATHPAFASRKPSHPKEMSRATATLDVPPTPS